jgi:hypothetical protein
MASKWYYPFSFRVKTGIPTAISQPIDMMKKRLKKWLQNGLSRSVLGAKPAF